MFIFQSFDPSLQTSIPLSGYHSTTGHSDFSHHLFNSKVILHDSANAGVSKGMTGAVSEQELSIRSLAILNLERKKMH